MRAPFQILVIPYKKTENGSILYCVFHRADLNQWQFIAGGGEDDETPLQAAKRETIEESSVQSDKWTELKSLSYIPAKVISEKHRQHWDKKAYVIPEYTFGCECSLEITLSSEHTECVWLPYKEAQAKLRWDSNKTALYELDCRLKDGRL